jgi:CO/xanthine dehydrogenase Mo-binding subunit
MPEWPTQNQYIGQATMRVDAAPKLTGRARYSSDIQADGWLYGMILRSKWPAAKILSVNLDKAQGLTGVKAVALARETPFSVRYYGEEIAGVAATSKQACLDALRSIEIMAEPRERFVVREDDARKEDSP